MKNLFLTCTFIATVAVSAALGQSRNSLKLSDERPGIGEKITISYNPAGTPLEGKTGLQCSVYFLDNKNYPVDDVTLQASGKELKGQFTIPENTKAFFIRIAKDGDVDDNHEKGYLFAVYKDKQPVAGAYACEAYAIGSGLGAAYGKMKTNAADAVTLYNKEFVANPQIEKDYQSGYLSALSSANTPESLATLNNKLQVIAASGDEKQMMLANSYYKRMKRTAQADSLTQVIKTKFPNGLNAKNEMSLVVNREKDPAKKEEEFNTYIAKYPIDPAEKRPIQDVLRAQVAGAYLNAGKLDDYQRIAKDVQDKTSLALVENNVAYEWAQKGEHLDDAAMVSKQTLDIMNALMKGPIAPQAFASAETMRKNYSSEYDMFADTYAYILFKQGKFKEALAYEQPVYEHSKGKNSNYNDNYIQILNSANDTRTMQVAEQAVRDGKHSPAVDDILKALYVKSKGSEAGYDSYFTSLTSASLAEMKTKLAKEMIIKPSPAFTLKDLDGKMVSLASLKGKVVVVDFWATWCGPCKASFPGMQLAVNKYKDNPNVQFVFVDTWENGDDYLPGVKKFIDDNKYSFHVLVDEKGTDGRQSKVVSTFGVEGIPTKFIIDANGNIRFKHVGYSGSTSGVLNEISTMVDMALNPDAVAAAPKVTQLEK